jgi:hypothetical protein
MDVLCEILIRVLIVSLVVLLLLSVAGPIAAATYKWKYKKNDSEGDQRDALSPS